jgi:hypothetical protein
MIIEFRVSNHRSFKKEQTLNLAASNYDKALLENVIEPNLPGLPDLRLVKAVALYGPNAGGKSNVLLALKFLRWLVVESVTGQKPEAELPTEPFRLDPEFADQPTTLELAFVADNVRYEFAVVVNRKRVLQERLVAYPTSRGEVWYDRVWDAEAGQYSWSPEKPSDFARDPSVVAATRENALYLSTATQLNNKQVASVYRWFDEQLRFLNLGAGWGLGHDFTAEMITKSPDVKGLIQNLLNSADLGLTAVDTKEKEVSAEGLPKALFALEKELGKEVLPRKVWEVVFHHKGSQGESFPLDWDIESAGTQRFFSILGPWVDIATRGYTVCIDELDTSLHPTLASELLRLLFKSTKGKPGAQVLFSTHNPLLLDTTLLRRDQIWFADKDAEGASFLYPLTDYKPRVDESLVRGYLSGRYGAVPFIPTGLATDSSVNCEDVKEGRQSHVR